MKLMSLFITLNMFCIFSSVSTVNFQHVFVCWEDLADPNLIHKFNECSTNDTYYIPLDLHEMFHLVILKFYL